MFRDSRLKNTALRILRAAFSSFVQSAADSKGHLEVERKFQISADEAHLLPEVLQSLGFKSIGLATMTDSFLPNIVPGEMLRVRQEQIDDEPAQTIFTFKQWVKTATGQERQERERTVRPAVASLWILVGRMLNGGPLLTFGKKRHLFEGQLDGSHCIASLDDVYGLGEFSGWYMEVEQLVPLGQDPAPYSNRIFPFVKKLLGEMRSAESRSYRDMLVASRSQR